VPGVPVPLFGGNGMSPSVLPGSMIIRDGQLTSGLSWKLGVMLFARKTLVTVAAEGKVSNTTNVDPPGPLEP
jgi:hypothetical protein